MADTRTDLLERVDATVFSEAHRGRRRDDENEAEDWRVGGFDVFERRSSPLRRKRAPLVPGEFDHDELVRRALERARVDVKAVGSARLATTTPRIPLRALVPGNAGLHRGVSEERASALVRDRSRRGVSFDDFDSAMTPTTVSASAEASAPTRTPTAERFVGTPSDASSAWSAESNAWSAEMDAATSSSRKEGVRLFVSSGSPSFGERQTDGCSSEETLKRQRRRLDARRRHRKRLAAIVVAQWRWFARDALENLPSKMHFFW